MPTVGAQYMNLSDLAKQSTADGMPVGYVAEVLSTSKPAIDHIPFTECNFDNTSHVSTHRSSIPRGTWVGPYDFVNPTKSTTTQVTDHPAILEAYSEVDTRILDAARDRMRTLQIQSTAFIEGMGQDFVEALIYGDTTVNPKQFDGLAKRYNSLSGIYGGQVISAGGSGADNTSIWMVTWGETNVTGIVPRGAMTGLKQEDLGVRVKENSTGGVMTVQNTKFSWNAGIAVGDPRAVVRIANIDVSDLQTAGSGSDTSPKLFNFLTRAYHKLKNPSIQPPLGRTMIYANANLLAYLDIIAQGKVTYGMTFNDYQGMPVLHYRGLPIFQLDVIRDNEAAVA